LKKKQYDCFNESAIHKVLGPSDRQTSLLLYKVFLLLS
jgi:hypothetical protein